MAIMQQPDYSLLRSAQIPVEQAGGMTSGSRYPQNSAQLVPQTGQSGMNSATLSPMVGGGGIPVQQQDTSWWQRGMPPITGNSQSIQDRLNTMQGRLNSPYAGQDTAGIQREIAARQNQLANYTGGPPTGARQQVTPQSQAAGQVAQQPQMQQQQQQQQMLIQLLRALMQRGQLGGGQMQTGGGIGQGYQQWQQPSAYNYSNYSMPQQNGYYTGGYAPGYQQYQQQYGQQQQNPYNMSSQNGSYYY